MDNKWIILWLGILYQTVKDYFSWHPQLYSTMSPLELFASLLAAMCHDLDHPGGLLRVVPNC